MATFFTIGHSTRSIGDFVQILRGERIGTVADVRTIPRSRTNPHFNIEGLPATLGKFGIGYIHLPELSGLRSRQRGAETSLNSFWDNQSFRNYADYAMGEQFRSGLRTLLDLGDTQLCAIMCAEAVWWRCHRRIIADYLINEGAEVFHLLGPGRSEPAHMTPAARQIEPHRLVYPKD